MHGWMTIGYLVLFDSDNCVYSSVIYIERTVSDNLKFHVGYILWMKPHMITRSNKKLWYQTILEIYDEWWIW